MGGRDHACERCGHGGFNDPKGTCTCDLERVMPDPVPADIARELYEALERIANTDWTEPPVDLPDEIARAALTRYEREVGG